MSKDYLGEIINIGDKVCFAPAGAYAGILVGVVEKFTPKSVCIVSEIRGRHINSKKYYARPDQVVNIQAINQQDV